jgi:hypothetical protein
MTAVQYPPATGAVDRICGGFHGVATVGLGLRIIGLVFLTLGMGVRPMPIHRMGETKYIILTIARGSLTA